MANMAIPIQMRAGKVWIRMMPAKSTHVTHREVNVTTGTNAERIFKGAYCMACCTACPVS